MYTPTAGFQESYPRGEVYYYGAPCDGPHDATAAMSMSSMYVERTSGGGVLRGAGYASQGREVAAVRSGGQAHQPAHPNLFLDSITVH